MSAIQKLTKTINYGSNHLWIGLDIDESYTAINGIFQIRGGGGNDVLTGNTRSDIYIFENTLMANGMDTITNFKTYDASSSIQDTLDLSRIFDSSFKKVINSSNVDQYIWIHNGDLHIDITGNHGDTTDEVFAHLDGISEGDQIHIRTSGFDGKIVATEELITNTLQLHADFYNDSDPGYISITDPTLKSNFISTHDLVNPGKVDDFRLYGLGEPIGNKIATNTIEQLQLLHDGVATGQSFDAIYNGFDAFQLIADDNAFVNSGDVGYAFRFVYDHVAYEWAINATPVIPG